MTDYYSIGAYLRFYDPIQNEMRNTTMSNRIQVPGEVQSWVVALLDLGLHDSMHSMIEPNSACVQIYNYIKNDTTTLFLVFA